jgi:hypothetical protein
LRERKTPDTAYTMLLKAGAAATSSRTHSNRRGGMDAEMLLNAFKYMNEDGTLTTNVKVPSIWPMSLIECQRLVHLLDCDGDGKISRKDFISSFGGGGSNNDTRDPFRKLRDILYDQRMTVSDFILKLDTNYDGRVDVDEWVIGLSNIAPKISSEEARFLARGLMSGNEINLTSLRQRLSDTLFSKYHSLHLFYCCCFCCQPYR